MHSFLGHRALIACRNGRDRSVLVKQLNRLGFDIELFEHGEINKLRQEAALLFFDTDYSRPLMDDTRLGELVDGPSIALLSTDSPSVIEWAIEQGANSFLIKPLRHTGVLAAMIIAFEVYASSKDKNKKIEELENRLKARPILCSAVVKIMNKFGMGEDEAFKVLRRTSMDHRVYIEQAAAMIVSGEIILSVDGGFDAKVISR